MIFSTKINKLPSGKNISLHSNKNDELEFYLFTNKVSKKIITFGSYLKCSSTNYKYSYNSVIKLNDNHLCVCFDDNMSVIKNEEI